MLNDELSFVPEKKNVTVQTAWLLGSEYARSEKMVGWVLRTWRI